MRVSKIRLALPAAAMAVGLAFGGGNAYALTPTVTVTPNTGLTNGQTVKVAWQYFSKTKNTFLAIVECNKLVLTDQNASHCDTGHAVIIGDGTTPAPSKGHHSFKARTGKIGDKPCGTTATNKGNCLIAVTGLDGSLNPVPGQAMAVKITFA
jgi:Neocarzinostatin family